MEHNAKIDSHTELPNSNQFDWKDIQLTTTEINISGKVVKVVISRLKNGNIEISPINEGITEEGGWLFEGTCTEGFNDEVIISQFNHVG